MGLQGSLRREVEGQDYPSRSGIGPLPASGWGWWPGTPKHIRVHLREKKSQRTWGLTKAADSFLPRPLSLPPEPGTAHSGPLLPSFCSLLRIQAERPREKQTL